MTTRVDRYTETQKQDIRYSDFLTNLTPHPNTNDLVRNTNLEAIKRSIRNLILTDKDERLMQPKIGSNIRKALFDPMTEQTASRIRQYIVETIGNYEPRAKVITVDVRADEPNHLYTVNIFFYAINKPEPVSLTVTLYRVR